jgi:hypothetical protein
MCTVFAARRTLIVTVLGCSVNLAALTIRWQSACASRSRSPRTNSRSSGTSTSSWWPPAVSLSWLLATAGLDDALDRDLLAHERDLPLRGAGDVDQLLDQMAEPADLTLEDLAQAHEDRVGVLERAQHAGGVGDRRERVAQLVRQHAEELPLAALGEAQLLGAFGERLLELLPFVDVDAAADVADRCAVGAEARHAVVEHPAVLAVVTAQAKSIENGAFASKLVARMPRQRSRSSGWTDRVQPSPISSSRLRPV